MPPVRTAPIADATVKNENDGACPRRNYELTLRPYLFVV